jgi:hypothetical protein
MGRVRLAVRRPKTDIHIVHMPCITNQVVLCIPSQLTNTEPNFKTRKTYFSVNVASRASHLVHVELNSKPAFSGNRKGNNSTDIHQMLFEAHKSAQDCLLISREGLQKDSSTLGSASNPWLPLHKSLEITDSERQSHLPFTDAPYTPFPRTGHIHCSPMIKFQFSGVVAYVIEGTADQVHLCS